MIPAEIRNKKVLVAPLNWGLGHATRCIPIIKQLLQQQNEVLLAGDGASLALLKAELPQLAFFTLPAYQVKYATNKKWLWWVILKQLPHIFLAIYQEHFALQKLIARHRIDMVISDNRYGLFSKKCITVFITHQVFIRVPPWLQVFIHFLHQKWIGFFNYCWIPDYVGNNNLSGALSHHAKPQNNYIFIGPLSRFQQKPSIATFDLLIVLSGPEPQRTLLQNILQGLLPSLSQYKVVFVRGTNSPYSAVHVLPHVIIKDVVLASELETLFNSAKKIIARSGYSTIMDLHALAKSALLIPTPGQTEQEYLAQHACLAQGFSTVAQQDLNIEVLLKFMQQ